MEFLINWLYGNVDQLVAASNFTIAIMMIVLGTTVVYYAHKLWHSIQTDLAWILIGVAAEAYGWAIHRLYWGLWRVARLLEDTGWDKWFVDNAYLSIVPSLMVVIGMVMILAPVVSIFLSSGNDSLICRLKHFSVVGFAAFSLFWFIFFQLGSIHQPVVSNHIQAMESVQPINVPFAATIPPRTLSHDAF